MHFSHIFVGYDEYAEDIELVKYKQSDEIINDLDNYVKDINDHLKVGDQVEVKVINVEKDGKIGLSIKKAVEKKESEAPSSYQQRPRRNNDFRGGRGDNRGGRGNDARPPRENFEQKMARFLKDSEERMSSLKRNTESKRGGRGGRRG